MKLHATCILAALLSLGSINFAQTAITTASSLPRLVRFGGTVKDLDGNPMTGVVGVTFALYSEPTGGVALWQETQNVTADANGHYVALLGSTKLDGVPVELFTSEQARWVGVEVSGQAEQPRVLLVSVPYAMKAADAQTLGGLPPSAFLLAEQGASTAASNTEPAPIASTSNPTASAPAAGTGTQNYIPIWTDSAGDLGNSILYQTGSGSSARLGVNITSPLSTLDVKGTELVRGLFELSTLQYATASKGYNSNGLNLESSAFNSGTNTYTLNHFQWQAEPVGNNTATPGATLNLLYGTDPAAPAETGLSLNSKGLFTFAPAQTFPGTGTVTSVGGGAGLTGGPITGSGTLSVATAGVTNSMLQNSSLTVSANSPLSGGGPVALGGSTSLGLKSCSNNQVLEFVSGAWTCTNLNSGSGTVTSVGLSAPSSDFTVSGSPVTTSGTLGLNWTVTPGSLDVLNSIVKRDPYVGGFYAGPSDFQAAVDSPGVEGDSNIGAVSGVYGYGINSATGVVGATDNTGGVPGVSGTGDAGVSGSGITTGVSGIATSSGSAYGVAGYAPYSESGIGVYGYAGGNNGTSAGVYGASYTGSGVYGYSLTGWALQGYSPETGTGILAGSNAPGYAGWFNGNVEVEGTFSATTKHFRIDHPLDPANKYLVHSSVESSEMKNIYDGIVTIDDRGEATVQLPDWFEALNTDFRYQLTAIGAPGPNLHIAEKVHDKQFRIAGGQPGMEVSWQITGVRQDPYAKANPLVVEEEKPEKERGFYLHPREYGAANEKGILWARYPEAMKQWRKGPPQPPEIKSAKGKPRR